MKHATNGQMAEIMGWTLDGSIYYTSDGHIVGFFPIGSGFKFEAEWNPIARLDHAALVEARLDELGLKMQYMRALTELLKDERGRSSAWGFVTAKAQTRCNAALQAFEASKIAQS
ncbi:MAG TPA: hypothetical protein VFZ66_29650 [Herpetosiphonaceae bacterium]